MHPHLAWPCIVSESGPGFELFEFCIMVLFGSNVKVWLAF